MKFFTPEISWHEREPIYTCAFSPAIENRFATGAVTGEIRIWELTEKSQEAKDKGADNTKNSVNADIQIDFIANLKRHTKAVNIVRWNNDGTILASAGDEPVVFLWMENDIKNQKTLDNDEFENKENWFVFKTLRGHLEDIYDVAWSSDASMLISGSIDNSAILWNVSTGSKVAILKEPKGYVQGVAYDPLGVTYAVLSSDRCLRMYSTNTNKCIHNVNKIQLANKENTENAPTPNIRIFHDDTFKSFTRRICFSPDGNFLFTPSGCLEIGEKIISTSYVFTRNSYTKPCLYIPHDKHSVAISVCPTKFELIKKTDDETPSKGELFNLPYRYVFAIATEDSVFFYDTDSQSPFAYISGIHYSNLTDLSWSKDGRCLFITSIDGFSTLVFFKPDELGRVYVEPEDPAANKEPSSQASSIISTKEL